MTALENFSITFVAALLAIGILTSGCDTAVEGYGPDDVAEPAPAEPVDPGEVHPDEPPAEESEPTPEFFLCDVFPGGISQGCCTTTAFDTATEPVPGMLVKSNAYAMVYYLASNGKRYVFPTAETLVSWYEPYHSEALLTVESDVCAMVVEFPASIVDALQIGGNVTFRPGSYVTGITSDPARYVVGRGGHLLHRLATPDMAEDFYPGHVAERTRILPDAFFVNYDLGDAVADPSEFDPAAEFASACLEEELGIVAP